MPADASPTAPAPLAEGLEIERKYDVPDGVAMPPLSGGDVHEPVTMVATYLDTPDAALARHQTALRRREGGKDAGWHLKGPATGPHGGRQELQAPLADDLPDELVERVRAIVRDAPLTPLARLTTTRTVVLVHADGAPVVEVVDDHVEAADVRGGTVRAWREWEAELLPGAPIEALDAVEAELFAAGARPSASNSKLAQALGATGLGLAPLPAPRPDGAAVDLVRFALERAQLAVVRADQAVRADASAEPVHALRVALRRLRSVLVLSRGVLERHELEVAREAFGRTARAFAASRDLAVRAEGAATLVDEETDIGAAEPLLRRLLVDDVSAESRRLATEARAQLDRPDHWIALDAVDALVARPPLERRPSRPAGEHGERVLRRAVKRSLTALRRAETAVELDLERPDRGRAITAVGGVAALDELHEARKAARRVRDLADALVASGLGGRKVEKTGAAARKLQRALGRHRDAVALLRALAAIDAGDAAFAAGQLAQEQAARVEAEFTSARTAMRAYRDRVG